MEEFRGYVTRIIYRNKENAYTVFEMCTEGDTLTCTGFPADISEGESCIVRGELFDHPLYGEQMKAASYEACEPEDREALYRYLSSGAIKGIGEAMAARIIKKFGDDTMRILDEEPERLAEVKGISEKGAREICLQLSEKRETREAMMFLGKYGIGNRQSLKIWNTYGPEMYSILKENPYKLAEDISGIGFVRADEIAGRIGISRDSDYRIRSGILYVLQQTLSEGSTCIPMESLVRQSVEILGSYEETIRIQIDNLAIERQLYIKRKDEALLVFSSYAFQKEQQIARMLRDLNYDEHQDYTEKEIGTRIRHIEEHEDIELDELQKEAVKLAVTRPMMILSGGPGTGKTTTINTIIRYFISDMKTVLLAAPTGRAAKRMSEATGYEAMTIHRLLGYRAAGAETTENEYSASSEFMFDRSDENPLEADAVIIDEMSMVDIFLFHALLKAIRPGTRLIMAGDVNQLPSVGPGKVLRDMMDTGVFSSVTLKKIFRQASQSDIVMNAHRILNEEPLQLDNKSKDFFFLERKDPAVMYKHIVQLTREMLPKYAQCQDEEIQILTPMKKGHLGSIRLNAVLQSVLNPAEEGKKEYTAHDTVFRIGDKVMQMKNNYQIEWEVPGNFGMALERGTGIFNGDFGKILDIDEDMQIVEIAFDENRVVRYPFRDLDDLDLAYAITVHKSQGSEYPAIIMPVLSGPPALLNRNLLYTAITRAKKCAVLMGSSETITAMAMNRNQSIRYTGLADRILEFMEEG